MDIIQHPVLLIMSLFQVESGDRIEMSVSGSEYGKLTEGDEGKLTFQGTRYLQFNMEN